MFKHKYRDPCTCRNSFWMIITNRLAFSGEASKACSEISLARTWFRRKREREERGGKSEWERGLATRMVTFNGSSMFVLSHPWCSHPVRARFTMLGSSARTAKTGIIHTTTAYPSRFPVNKYASWKVNLWSTCAHMFPSLYPPSIPQSPNTSSLFSPPP